MIISASRRTDIPAFYSQWFMNRIRAGFCNTINPYNRRTSEVSLLPGDVDVIVFWTKNARPMLRHIPELKQRGYEFFFHYTINNYGKPLENVPTLTETISTIESLASAIGPERIIWRYDPILVSNQTNTQWHVENFRHLAQNLNDCVHKVIISRYDDYARARKRLCAQGLEPLPVPDELVREIAAIAKSHGLDIESCAEDMVEYGIARGKCIDAQYIEDVFGLTRPNKKDSGQRRECGCILSRDIGAYNTCRYSCLYCYARPGSKAAHDPNALALAGE